MRIGVENVPPGRRPVAEAAGAPSQEVRTVRLSAFRRGPVAEAAGAPPVPEMSEAVQESSAMEVQRPSGAAEAVGAPPGPLSGDFGMQEDETGQSGTALCGVCRELRKCLSRHLHWCHLPWFWVPEKACWHCCSAASSQAHLQSQHWDVHPGQGKFGSHELGIWFHSIVAVLEVFAAHFGIHWTWLGALVRERGWLEDMEASVSIVREVLGEQLEQYWSGTVDFTTSAPGDLSAVLHWRTAMRMLAEMPKELQLQVAGACLVHNPLVRPVRTRVIDGHCHLELLRRRLGFRATLQEALDYFSDVHWTLEVEGLEAVVSNQVFREEWEADVPPVVGQVRVIRTWGAHPKALDQVDWRWLERKMASLECAAVGECGLDETAPNMARQEAAFKRQIELAHQLKKPLVLHLRGNGESRTSAIYGRALAITTSILERQHPVYLHSFSASAAEFKLWHRAFPKLLVGCSWMTADSDLRLPMLRMMPTGTLVLETDSPHQAPHRVGINSPCRLHEQAALIAEIRNVPVSTLLECSNRALRKFFHC